MNELDPITFWQQLKGTIALHDAIFKTRKELKELQNPEKKISGADKKMNTAIYSQGLIEVLTLTKSFHKLFERFFIDMDRNDFIHTPSVIQAYDTHLINYNNRYKLLSSIDLYNHTMNVVRATKKLSEEHNFPQQVNDIAILLAILHDFGKNQIIAKEFLFEKSNEKEKRHHRISANYAKHTMFGVFLEDDNDGVTKEFIDMVYSILRAHHEDEKNNNMFLEILINADQNAREKELFEILKKEKSK